MHLSTHYAKQLITWLLSVQLCLVGILPAAVQANEADEFIKKSHEMAKERAKSLMNETLIEAMLASLKSQIKGSPEQVKQAMDQIQVELNRNLQQLEPLLAIDPSQASKLTGKELTLLSQEFRQTLNRLRLNNRYMYDVVAQVRNQRGVARQVIEEFLKNLDNQCREGLAIDPYNEILPAIHPLMPSYEFNFSVPIYGEDTGDSAARRSVSVGHGAGGVAIWTTIYALNTVVVGSILAGKLVLTQAAMQSANVFGAALIGGFGVTLVIALVALAIMSHEAQQESERMVKDQRRVFEDQAKLEDGRRYFQTECRAAQRLFGDVLGDMDKIESEDKDTIEKLDAQKEKSVQIMQEFIDVLRAYHKKREKLFEKITEGSSNQERTAAAKQLEESEEGKRMKAIGEKLTPEKLVSLIRFSFLSNFKNAHEIANAIDLKQLDFDFSDLESRSHALRELAFMQNMRESGIQAHLAWQAELKQNQEVTALYSELDRLIVRKANWIFSLEKDLRVSELTSIKADMAKWYERLSEALKQNPASQLLRQLHSDFGRVSTIGEGL